MFYKPSNNLCYMSDIGITPKIRQLRKSLCSLESDTSSLLCSYQQNLAEKNHNTFLITPLVCILADLESQSLDYNHLQDKGLLTSSHPLAIWNVQWNNFYEGCVRSSLGKLARGLSPHNKSDITLFLIYCELCFRLLSTFPGILSIGRKSQPWVH